MKNLTQPLNRYELKVESSGDENTRVFYTDETTFASILAANRGTMISHSEQEGCIDHEESFYPLYGYVVDGKQMYDEIPHALYNAREIDPSIDLKAAIELRERGRRGERIDERILAYYELLYWHPTGSYIIVNY